MGEIKRDEAGRPFVVLDNGERCYLDAITTGTGNVGIGCRAFTDGPESLPPLILWTRTGGNTHRVEIVR